MRDNHHVGDRTTHGVIGMLARLREPSEEGVAPGPDALGGEPFDCRRGVSCTRRRKSVLFIADLRASLVPKELRSRSTVSGVLCLPEKYGGRFCRGPCFVMCEIVNSMIKLFDGAVGIDLAALL